VKSVVYEQFKGVF